MPGALLLIYLKCLPPHCHMYVYIHHLQHAQHGWDSKSCLLKKVVAFLVFGRFGNLPIPLELKEKTTK